MHKQAIYDSMQSLAPDRLQASWDNCGLQVGRLDEPVTGVMVSLNPTPGALEAAANKGANLLVTHHPLFFKLPSRLDTSREPGKTIEQALKSGITIVSFHTSLDSAMLNTYVAEKLGWSLPSLLAPMGKAPAFKLVVFVPTADTEKVAAAMWEAGAGKIGNYDEASFRSEGTGTFRPLPGAHPAIGTVGALERVPETRLEAIVPESKVRGVLQAMKQAHPYEEVAYDLIRLEDSGQAFGFGLFGEVGETTVRQIAKTVQDVLAPRTLRVAGNLDLDRAIRRIGLCGGGGSELVQHAIDKGLDVFITGECKYHAALDAQRAGLTVLEAGHLATEQPIVHYLVDFLAARCGVPVEGYWEEEPFQPLGEL